MEELNLRVFCTPGEKEGTFTYHVRDGLYYHFSFERDDSIYLKCVRRHSHGCFGRAVIHRQRGFRHSKNHINHDREPLYEQELLLRNQVMNRCRSMEITRFKDILAQERQGFHPDVQAKVPYVRLRSSMLRARRSKYPPPPRNLAELRDILSDPQYEVISQTRDEEDNLFAGAVTIPDGSTHVLFASQRMLGLLRRCKYVFSDGTFKVVPSLDSLRNRRAQVFSIVTTWRGHTLPIALALMENRTQAAYEGILSLINGNLNGQVNIGTVVTDDEPAQHQAWEAVFRVALQDCLFHMDKSYVKKILELGLRQYFYDPGFPEFRYIVRLACGLPLLPREYLITGWRCMRRESREVGGVFLRNLLQPFFEYLWNEYIGNAARSRRMSVFGSQHRTNNCLESTNRDLNDRFGPHPAIYDFINGIKDIEHQSYIDFLTLHQGLEASRARKWSALSNDRALKRLGEELIDAPFGDEDAILRYLQAASYRVQGLIANLADNFENQYL